MDYSIKIGGEAGQGIQTIGEALARVFTRSGYYVFTHQDYESRIRGGHNFYQIRFSDRPVSASRSTVDIVVALDTQSITDHGKELTEYGQIIYDSATLKQMHEAPQFLDVPFNSLAIEHGGSKIMANTVATGAVLGMLGMDPDVLLALLKETFKKKGEDVVRENVSAAMAGYDFAVKKCIRCSFSVGREGEVKSRMVINGAEAIGLGALAAGCKFYSAYPMTPSTGVMLYVASKAKEYGVIVEQAEDEIAAINMALGASFAGVRAMTGTSGGGFALMVEGLSLAAITETPVVIALAQRPGPATGFPTRTEQGDLLFALHTAHGEFPRIILAPGSPEQAFYHTVRAFDLAEKYQVPSIVIFDAYFADAQWTHDSFDLSGVKYIDYRLRGEEFGRMQEYKRHTFTETGVSPLAIPGDGPHVVVTDSDEHDEEGHIVEDAETRIRMVDKRLFKKMPLIRREMEPPTLYGDPKPDVVIVGWGSTYGVMREAVDSLAGRKSIAMLHFGDVYPLPDIDKLDYLSLLSRAGQSLCVEHNATGQFARLLRAETGFTFSGHIRRYDGRPFTTESLMKEIDAHTGKL